MRLCLKRLMGSSGGPPPAAAVARLTPVQVALQHCGPSTWIVALGRAKEVMDAMRRASPTYRPKPDDYRQLLQVARGADQVAARRLCLYLMHHFDFTPDAVTIKLLHSIRGCANAAFMRVLESRYLAKHSDINLELTIAAREGAWMGALDLFHRLSRVAADPHAAKKVVRALGKADKWCDACRFAAAFAAQNPAAAVDVRLTSDVLRSTAAHRDPAVPLQFCALLLAQGNSLMADNVATIAQIRRDVGSPHTLWEAAVRLFAAAPSSPLQDIAVAPTLLKAMQQVDYYAALPLEELKRHRDCASLAEQRAVKPPPIVPPLRLYKAWREVSLRLFSAFMSTHPLGGAAVMNEPWMFFLGRKCSEGTVIVLDTNFILWMLAHGVKDLDRIWARTHRVYPFLKARPAAVLVPFAVYRELCGLLFNSRVKSKSRWRHRLMTLMRNPTWHLIHLSREMEAQSFTFISDATGRHFESDPDRRIAAVLLLLQYYNRTIALAAINADTSVTRVGKYLGLFARYHLSRSHGALTAAPIGPADRNVVFMTFDKAFSATCQSMGVVTFPSFNEAMAQGSERGVSRAAAVAMALKARTESDAGSASEVGMAAVRRHRRSKPQAIALATRLSWNGVAPKVAVPDASALYHGPPIVYSKTSTTGDQRGNDAAGEQGSWIDFGSKPHP